MRIGGNVYPVVPDVPPALDRGRLYVLVHAAGSNAGMWRRPVEAATIGNSVGPHKSPT